MSEPGRIVIGMLPTQFEEQDAPAVIGLAAAALGFVGAVGNKDPATLDKLLLAAARSFGRMRPEAKEALIAAADEFVEATQQGKTFMVMGGFRRGDQKP